MSIEIPKYTIQEITDTSKKIAKKWFYSAVVISFILGFLLNNYYSKYNNKILHKRNIVLEESSSTNQSTVAQLKAEINILKTEQKVKQQSTVQLQIDYKSLLSKNNILETEIIFYEKLLNPKVKTKGLKVLETKIQDRGENNYKLELIVVQRIEKAREISGKIRVTIVGKTAGKVKKIQISKNTQKYRLKYFQNISYAFLLPNGFNPEQLVVELFPDYKKSKSVIHTEDWLLQTK